MRELNARIADLPRPHRLSGLWISNEGFPIPWFVPMVNGLPEFRAMSTERFRLAVRTRRCWICGGQLGKFLTFPIGPMCAVTRTTAEPPSHLECCEYSVKACPFLSQPRMRRNEKNLPQDAHTAGVAIKRNPGVTVLWTCLDFRMFEANGTLFRVGEPEHVECWTEGRAATKDEVIASIDGGYPLLEKLAIEQGEEALTELKRSEETAWEVLGLS